MLLVLSFLAGLLATPASAVTMDWVLVGDPGNAPDTASNCFAANCGSVAYAYQISKYEVTNAQYAEFLNAKAAADPFELYNPDMGSDPFGGITQSGASGSFAYTVKAGFASKPVNFVSFYDALRFTNWLNNGQGSGDTETGAYTFPINLPPSATTVARNPGAILFLPSEAEWYKAAYYNDLSASYFDYPAGTNATTMCSGPTATPNSANCEFAVGNVTEVGAYTGSASPSGTFDQGGNVFEWNETISNISVAGLRGGAWNFDANDLAASTPLGTEAIFEFENIGFRVASLVPEPGTGLLLMTGLAGLAVRRRKVGQRRAPGPRAGADSAS